MQPSNKVCRFDVDADLLDFLRTGIYDLRRIGRYSFALKHYCGRGAEVSGVGWL